MKKGLILITVILFGLVLALRYVEEKSGKSDKKSVQIQNKKDAQGVSLPIRKNDYIVTDYLQPENFSTGSVSYDEPLALSAGEADLKKACKKGSLKDIFIAHGQIWGYGVGDSRAFNTDS